MSLIGAALISGGASILGSGLSGLLGRSSAKQQQRASERMYKHRHQWAVDDLRKAGLNPILSAQGGAGSAPTAAQAQVPQIDLPGALSKTSASQLAKAQVETEKTEQVKNLTQARQFDALRRSAEVEAGMSESQYRMWNEDHPLSEGLATARAIREASGTGLAPSLAGTATTALGSPAEFIGGWSAKGYEKGQALWKRFKYYADRQTAQRPRKAPARKRGSVANRRIIEKSNNEYKRKNTKN